MMSTLIADNRGVLSRCPQCGKTNRLGYGALDRTIRCGSCHAPMAAPDAPVEAPDAASFDALVGAASLPVLVDFWAPWCGPCRMMAPELETAARRMAGQTLVVKVNTDSIPELGERYRIQSIPTLAVFRQGREVARASGARAAADIQALAARG
jgi:thioredoxin 2